MAVVPNNRELLFEEETSRNNGVSESLAKKFAGISNFISLNQLIRDDFKANGSYRLGVGSVGIDGLLIFPNNVEIVYIAMSNQRSGLIGTTIFDINWLSAPGVDEGSIFTTLPSIDFNSVDDTYILTDVLNVVDIVTATGAVNPRVNKTSFLQGEAIRCSLTSGMSAGEDAQINVFYRPIN
ncbi:MAG: hypothetical protein KJO73_09145 [Croceitalea sp.]|nr:hypothetical protein [Croceitalea sp.]